MMAISGPTLRDILTAGMDNAGPDQQNASPPSASYHFNEHNQRVFPLTCVASRLIGSLYGHGALEGRAADGRGIERVWLVNAKAFIPLFTPAVGSLSGAGPFLRSVGFC
jgi:hypothetical protein